MYPFLRLFYHQQKAKRKPQFAHPFEESTIKMRVWPWDIDVFFELNNGKYLTLMDMGRFTIGIRIGLFKCLKANDWGLMVGAVSSRYRRRLKTFEAFTLHSKLLYFDDRWFYFHQWFVGKDGQMKASFLVRTAVVSKKGLVATSAVVNAMQFDQALLDKHNHPSEWVKMWEESDEIHKEIMGE